MSDTATPEVNWVHKVCLKFLVVYLVDNIYLTLLRKTDKLLFFLGGGGGIYPIIFLEYPKVLSIKGYQ